MAKKKKKSSGFNKPSSNFSSKKKKSFNVSRFGNQIYQVTAEAFVLV